MLKKAPGKWKPRWTGPHKVIEVREGKYSNRYTIGHVRRRTNIENVKSDKLRPYTPWSTTIASTSEGLDNPEAPYIMGAWCKAGELFIVPLAKPYPFGMGKVMKAHDDGRIEYQWYNSKGYGTTKAWQPMWWDGRKSYTGHKKGRAHTAFADEEAKVIIKQEDLVMHGFTLTKNQRLREEVLEECSKSADIWWKRREK